MTSDSRKTTFVNLTSEPLDSIAALKFVSSQRAGAIVTFAGTTRSTYEDKVVAKLEYEAYEPMAVKKLEEIVEMIHSRWEVESIWLQHRLGEVPSGETSVLVCIASIHRKEALHSVEFAIDTLKETVPIWKKEVYGDGTSTWKENVKP